MNDTELISYENKSDNDELYTGLIIAIIILNIISIIIYIFLFIVVSRKYFSQPLFIQFKLELVISCFFHQLSLFPLFTKNIDNNFIFILCKAQTFVNNLTNMFALFLCLAMPITVYLMFHHSETIEKKKTKYHLIILFSICIISSIASLLIIIYGDIRPEKDNLCMYQNETVMLIEFIFSFFLLFGTVLCFCLLRHKIRKMLEDSIDKQDLENKYLKGLSKFYFFLVFIIIFSLFDFAVYIHFRTFTEEAMLITADMLEVTFFPIIAMVYCFNYESIKIIIKNLCFCNKNRNYEPVKEYGMTQVLLTE